MQLGTRWFAFGVGTALLAAAACSPDSSLPPNNGFPSTGSGGAGGDPFQNECADATDPDGDLVASSLEGDGDTDGDGTPDAKDTDSDGDGYTDAVEATNARLGSGQPGQARTEP